ncbi:MAG: AAA family ATPase [Desulfobulbaceae bacterium]|nr:AAA family ATPase [Desulfobulbaceae bacterium]
MYEKFYGLSEKPFHIVPNPNFLYFSSKHQNALTYLEYGIREGMGFILLTGEIGTGKTTLIRYLLNQIEAEIEVAVIFNTNVSADQLLGLILQEFEVDEDGSDKAKKLDLIHHFLIKKYAAKQRVLLIIDEAQNLSEEVLEEVRMLSNLQADDNLLLQIMLVGQPELKLKLKKPSLAQLTQRIAVNYHLMPLSEEETRIYIASRLEKVGGKADIFNQDAVEEIFRASGGTPRSINLLCDSALVYGFADEAATIDRDVILQVIEDKGDIGTSTVEEEVVVAAGNSAGVLKESDQAEIAILHQRLAGLEDRVRELRHQLDWHIEELGSQAQGYKAEMVKRLTDEIAMEREKNEKLLVNYGRIKEKVQFLEERNALLSAGKNEPPPSRAKSQVIEKRKKKSWFSFSF